MSDSHYGFRIILLIAIVAVNAFFAAAEVALVSVRESRLRQLAEQGHVGAQAALNLLANPERLLSVTQMGVTLASLGLGWAGEDPSREGLLDTPKRVVEAYRDWFSGYAIDPTDYLARTFEEVAGYDEMIVLRDIEFESHCEHHMAPIIGRAHVGYLPTNKVVGISKLARVVDGYARRFQVQEKLTAQIAQCIASVLRPRGVGVVIDAVHQCMTTRGVHKRGVSMVTSKMLGAFREDARTRAEFLRFIDGT